MVNKHPVLGTAIGLRQDRIYPFCSIVLFWSCNDAFQRSAKGNLSTKVKAEVDADDLMHVWELIDLLQKFPNHMIIGLGSAGL